MADVVEDWCGKAVADMDREELLEAFQELARLYQKQLSLSVVSGRLSMPELSVVARAELERRC